MLPSNRNVIRANPLLATYQTLFVISFIGLGGLLALLILRIVIWIILGPEAAGLTKFPSILSLYIILFLCYIPSFVSTVLQRRYWKRIERRRLGAAAGDRSLLAVEQPLANPAALPLPYTITLRLSKESILVLMGLLLVFALLIGGVFAWLFDGFLFISPDRFHNFLVLFAITATFMVIALLAIFLSPLGRQKVEVTGQGLSARHGGQKGAVRWEEARLFAMYNTWGAQKSGSSITYELSSATEIARWNWVQRPKLFRMSMVPTVPFDDYHGQMQALNGLIVARTGLPLYDLRAEPAPGWQGTLIPDSSRRNA